jgi:predicted transposase/invertase (TIGR01784 family)
MERRTYRPSADALLDPSIDQVFKALFTHNSPESKGALKDFLSIILDKRITTVSLLPNEPPVDDSDDKQTRFDIACTFDNGESADIEMQGKNENNAYAKRSEYLCARLLNYVVPRGLDWQDIPQVYQISLVNFDIDALNEEPLSWFEMRKQSGMKLSSTQNILFIELPKIRRMLKQHKNIPPANLPKLIKWCIFLSEAGNPEMQSYVNQLIKTEDGIMQAHAVLRTISSNDALWKKELDEEVVERDRRSFIHAWEKKVSDAQKILADSEKKLSDSEKKLSDSEKKLSDSEKKLSDSEKKLSDSEKKLSDSEKKLSDSEKKLSSAKRKLSAVEQKNAVAEQKITIAEQQAATAAKEKALEIAKNMMRSGMNVEAIASCTGLSVEEVKQI